MVKPEIFFCIKNGCHTTNSVNIYRCPKCGNRNPYRKTKVNEVTRTIMNNASRWNNIIMSNRNNIPTKTTCYSCRREQTKNGLIDTHCCRKIVCKNCLKKDMKIAFKCPYCGKKI